MPSLKFKKPFSYELTIKAYNITKTLSHTLDKSVAFLWPKNAVLFSREAGGEYFFIL